MLNSKKAYKRGAVNEAKVIHFFGLFNNKKNTKATVMSSLDQCLFSLFSVECIHLELLYFELNKVTYCNCSSFKMWWELHLLININVSAQNVHLYKLDHWFHEKKWKILKFNKKNKFLFSSYNGLTEKKVEENFFLSNALFCF